MKRRDFLRTLMAAGAGATASLYGNPFGPRFRFAHAQTGVKTLVVVFQRGGADGLNECVPYGLDEYYAIRPTIAIPDPSASGSAKAIDLDGFFGLHPAMAPLKPIYDAGDLAIFPACHYPNASRSHFDGQENVESGRDSATPDGWLNRYLAEVPRTAALRAVGFGSGLPHSLKGDVIVSSFRNITNFTLDLPDADAQLLIQDLTNAYGQPPDPGRLTRELVAATGRVTVNDLTALARIVAQSYTPANGATYPSSTFGSQMRQTAQLVKADVGLEVATVTLSGWDTHNNQGGTSGSMASRLADFSASLAAFHQDMGSGMGDVVVVTMSEFGRTSVENGSQGADHAHATTWLAMGGPILGGQIYPHLSGNAQALYPGALRGLRDVRGRYLDHSVDFRDVMGEVLTRHLGATNLANILPNHDYQPVGFLS